MPEPGGGEEGGAAGPALCLACKKAPIAYECAPCACKTLCSKCAMKMATGGKCKVDEKLPRVDAHGSELMANFPCFFPQACGELFSELRRVRKVYEAKA
ncbi:unnamed protein product [Chrysoparadoxa australica]